MSQVFEEDQEDHSDQMNEMKNTTGHLARLRPARLAGLHNEDSMENIESEWPVGALSI